MNGARFVGRCHSADTASVASSSPRNGPSCCTPGRRSPSGNSSQPRSTGLRLATICFTSCPLYRWLVNFRTRSRSFFVAFEPGHRCMRFKRGFRWALRFSRIEHPRNTKPSLPRLKSTNRVFTGCSVDPAGSSRAPSAGALPSPTPTGTSPPDRWRMGPESRAGCISPPRSDPTYSGRYWVMGSFGFGGRPILAAAAF